MREIFEWAGITANDVAVHRESISCVILSPKRMLRTDKLGGDWRVDDDRVDRGEGIVGATSGLRGSSRRITRCGH